METRERVWTADDRAQNTNDEARRSSSPQILWENWEQLSAENKLGLNISTQVIEAAWHEQILWLSIQYRV